ncbi:MAG: acyl-ACP--UDP-N-acetylglucosamine O-acyltransferase [Muribaculaceae bacterium]|nr:acyl-ACP--UDP-N-acetylglucosamine O-acyltransferase [Muribaculaceae bacterium]
MISPLAHVDPSAKIGQNVKISPFAFVDKDVEIGDNCEIFPYASLMPGTRLGKGCRVFQGSIISAEPQDFRYKGDDSLCIIGDNVTIREHVIINRSIHAGGATRVGNDTFILAESHIGHDSVIEGKSVLGNGVNIAGDCHVGKYVILSSNAMLHENSKVGDWVLIKGGCRVSGNVPPYIIVAHNPVAYFGVNAFIMRKHGFTEEQIDDIAKAYRNIYQSGISVFNALRRIEADIDPSEIRDNILTFIRSNNQRIVAIPIDLEG